MISIAHLSDLHFGDKLANRKRSRVPHQDPHDFHKCTLLSPGIEAAKVNSGVPKGVDLNVVVSGDLSVCGASEELAVAHAFIRSRPEVSRLPYPYGLVGLNVKADYLGAVPGNHDHWGGDRTMRTTYTQSLFDEQFRVTPWVKTWTSNPFDFDIDIFGVDSNSGFEGAGRYSLGLRVKGAMARGCISQREFSELEDLLEISFRKEKKTVRAIVLHHSVSYRSTNGLLELEQTSRENLLTLAAEFNVSVVLTGHAHISNYSMMQKSDSKHIDRAIHELRCSATVGWGPDTKGEAGFLFHRITRDGNFWNWDSWRYGWNGSRYVCAGGLWQGFRGEFR